MRPGIEDGFARSCYAAPDRIVVATALTDLEYLVPEAIAHAEASQAELLFVHAIAPGGPPAKTAYSNPWKADRDARLALEVLSRHVRARNITCSVAVRHGTPLEVLEEFLQERNPGRLIIGREGDTESRKKGLGRTATQLLLQTPIPVCAVPSRGGEFTDGAASGQSMKCNERPRTILYPVGEQGPNREGLRFALDLAQYLHSELILLQISKTESRTSDSSSISCAAGLWPRMRRIWQTDASARGLWEAAGDARASMLLLEAPPSLCAGTAFPATIAEVVAEASCPVLTFPVLPRDHAHPDLRVLAGTHSSQSAISTIGVNG
jgi:nucleotide-binding universal stress UspA family protein